MTILEIKEARLTSWKQLPMSGESIQLYEQPKTAADLGMHLRIGCHTFRATGTLIGN